MCQKQSVCQKTDWLLYLHDWNTTNSSILQWQYCISVNVTMKYQIWEWFLAVITSLNCLTLAGPTTISANGSNANGSPTLACQKLCNIYSTILFCSTLLTRQHEECPQSINLWIHAVKLHLETDVLSLTEKVMQKSCSCHTSVPHRHATVPPDE